MKFQRLKKGWRNAHRLNNNNVTVNLQITGGNHVPVECKIIPATSNINVK